MSATSLIVLIGGKRAGELRSGSGGKLTFAYDDRYATPDAIELSRSLPLSAREHRDTKIVEAFFWGLLPDNDRILEAWARRYGVSSRSLIGLLSHTGEECPGAVQVVKPERVEALSVSGPEEVAWLTDADVASRLRALRADPSAWRTEEDTGQLSLAGAQPKTALLRRDGRWGVPSGRTPTTHILKPPITDLEGHAENEHACLSLARELGLPAARSEVCRFEDQVAIVVERFDRVQHGTRIVRLHQEDLCQALGVHPRLKYESDGGPGAQAIVELLRSNSPRAKEDVDTFIGALIMSHLIGATDAHAKNYALLHGDTDRVRLAPLYDVASVLPHGRYDPRRTRLAMKIGGKSRLRDIGEPEWRKLAKLLHLDEAMVLERWHTMKRDIAGLYQRVRDDLREQGITHSILDELGEKLEEHVRSVG